MIPRRVIGDVVRKVSEELHKGVSICWTKRPPKYQLDVDKGV